MRRGRNPNTEAVIKPLGDLEPIDITNHSDTERVYLPAFSGSETRKMNIGDMAEMLWEQMYGKAKKVVVTCLHCGSANVIINSNCVSCGAPMGKAIEDRD